MNNFWNKIIYKGWSPVYDKFFNTRSFLQARKQLFENIKFAPEESVLFVGVGTGADLEQVQFSRSSLKIKAIDFSPEMLEMAKQKFPNSAIDFLEMDAQQMDFKENFFDFVVASLILSVIPDPNACFQESVRVTKLGGKIIIFDKFVPKGKKLSPAKKLLRPIVSFLGTDIGLSFETIFQNYRHCLIIEEDEPVMMNGMYRRIVIRKVGEGDKLSPCE
jgi:phosphatidylethanolamine/phosphatidyl-N-methylethanolamine N-methyltransferase